MQRNPSNPSAGGRPVSGRLARRLLVVLLPLVMGPLLIAAPFLFSLAERDITAQIVLQLQSQSVSTEHQIIQWAEAHKAGMNNLAASPDVQEAARAFVLEPAGPAMSAGGDTLRQRLERFVAANPDYEALLIIHGRTGEVLLSTNAYRQLVGQAPLDPSVLSAGRAGPVMAPVQHYPQFAADSYRILIAAPVIDPQQAAIALVVGVIPGERLAALAVPLTALGEAGRAYIVAGDGHMLGESIQAGSARPDSLAIRQTLIEHQDGQGVYPDAQGRFVVGFYNWIPDFDMALLIEEDENTAFAPLTRLSGIAGVVVALGALVGAAGVLWFTRSLTRPIHELTAGAQGMAAGDLSVQVNAGRRDELGDLGQAFNSMAGQLKENLDTLEQRVADRTAELAQASEQMRYRAIQLQTVAEVAHAVASEQDLGKLLPLVTESISEQFRFYHVGVFLVDESGEFAVLQSANSEGGQRMLARGHKLRVGQTGIVGYVTSRGEPRIAVDVGMDAEFFNNPDLPLTRSEMAVPLKVRDRTIGALDVQSQQPAAFTAEDASLIGILADQIAIAIENARLFATTRQALSEVQSVHRQYLRQEWDKLAAIQPAAHVGYRFTSDGAVRLYDVPAELPEAAQALDSGEMVVSAASTGKNGQGAAAEGLERAELTVPIKLRGQVIGVIDLQRSDPAGAAPWSREELELAQSVADQVGLALENARLFEETMRRVQRERTVAAITDRIYSAADARSVLQIAAEELRRVTGSARAIVRVNRQGSSG